MTNDLSRPAAKLSLVSAARRALTLGPMQVDRLLLVVQATQPSATRDLLIETLNTHYRVFEQRGSTWHVIPEKPYVPAVRPSKYNRSARLRPAKPSEPTARQQPSDRRRETTHVMHVDLPGVTPFGRRLVVDVPSSAAAHESAPEAGDVILIATGPSEDPLDLGIRTVLKVSELPEDESVLRLVLSEPDNSQGVLPSGALRSLAAARSTGTSLMLLQDWRAGRVSALSTRDLERLASRSRPANRRRSTASLISEARRLLAHVGDDQEENWPRFASWLVSLDEPPRTIEALLLQASEVAPAASARLAVDALSIFDPEDPDYAAVFLRNVLDLNRSEDLPYCGRLLYCARSSQDADQLELDYLSGRLAFGQDRYEDAYRLLSASMDYFDEGNWIDLIVAAASLPGHTQREACKLILQEMEDDNCPADLDEVLVELPDMDSNQRRLIASTILTRLTGAGESARAVKSYDAMADLFPSVRDRLDLLSALESAPTAAATQALHGRLCGIFGEVRGGMDVDLFADLLRQIHYVEVGLGQGYEVSDAIRQRIDALRPELTSRDDSPFEGYSILIVGGLPSVLERISNHLTSLGASDVKCITTEKHERVDSKRITSSMTNRTHALLMSDHTGHAQQEVVRPAAQSRGIPFIITGGGATRVERDLRRQACRQAEPA